MVGLTFTSTKTADGKQNFKTCHYFLNLEFSFPSGVLPTLSALHAIRGFRMPFALKEIRHPFAGAKGYLITACNTLLFSRIFSILHAVPNPLLHTAKRNPIPFRPETKGSK